MGGLRGPATSYYLPYLSAVQLLVPADDAGVAAAVTAAAAAGEGPGSPAAPRLLPQRPGQLARADAAAGAVGGAGKHEGSGAAAQPHG